jgi:beta-lactamase regulating signal transducer with metallopeptidase domain
LIYIEQQLIAVWVFGIALVLLILSLALLIREIQISVEALEHHLGDLEKLSNKRKMFK